MFTCWFIVLLGHNGCINRRGGPTEAAFEQGPDFCATPRWGVQSALRKQQPEDPALISYLIYFGPDWGLSKGRVLSTWVVFLESFGVGGKDHGVRSQGEDKVTDWAKALGQRQAAESNPTETLLTTNYDQIHHPALSTHVSSWTLYHFHMCISAELHSNTHQRAYQHAAQSRVADKGSISAE